MKKIIIALTMCLSMVACKHEAPTPELKTIDYIPGQWQYEDGRTFEIGSPENCAFPITFSFQIHSPIQKPVTISYTYAGDDTIKMESGNIYPDCYFFLEDGHIKGMMQEYLNQPGQGEFIPIIKNN